MSHVLFAKPNDARSNKILIAVQYTKTPIDVDANFKFPQDLKKKELKNNFPVGKVPVLSVAGKGPIFESNAILRFIGRQEGSSIYGKDAFEAALIDQWLDFANNEIQLPADAWLYPIWGHIDNNPAVTAKAQSDIRRVLSILNIHLLNYTYLVGERITLADIGVVSALYPLFVEVLDLKTRKPFFSVFRWYKTCINQPEFKAVLGTLSLCEKAKVAPAASSVDPPKQQPVKPQPQKKAPKKKVEKEEKDDDEEPEEHEPKEKKNPLDDLPPSKLNLDEWKRVYSNEDTRTKALPWFFENYDPAGYCIWFCSYKYNDELTTNLKSLNLAGGFLQRLDKLRKYGFGTLVIFGEEPKQELAGCWLFRGTAIPAPMIECDDCELYEWVQADLNKEVDKKLIEDFWAWDGEFGGKKFASAKTFK